MVSSVNQPCVYLFHSGIATEFELQLDRVVYKSQQPAKFVSFFARFCWLLSLLQESKYGKEMMFIRSKLRLNKNINLL